MADTRLADANVDAAASQGRVNVTLEAGTSIGADFDDDDSESTNDSVGLRVSVPLFQGGAIRSRTRAQRALRSASNLDLAAAQRGVQESVTNAWTGLASARAAVDSAREQVEAAELAYEGVTLEQETGLRSTVEVLDQEADLLTARIRWRKPSVIWLWRNAKCWRPSVSFRSRRKVAGLSRTRTACAGVKFIRSASAPDLRQAALCCAEIRALPSAFSRLSAAT
ncbi:MAG: TolC family protein [Hyphomonadaceae bacterium JAD_PAG50586_4]|nr:MAG: TolC family protein [Hyphomonadaceae bacterium JAD_PAG50586_4]